MYKASNYIISVCIKREQEMTNENWSEEDMYLYNYKCIGRRGMHLYLDIQSLLLCTKHKYKLYIYVCIKWERTVKKKNDEWDSRERGEWQEICYELKCKLRYSYKIYFELIVCSIIFLSLFVPFLLSHFFLFFFFNFFLII